MQKLTIALVIGLSIHLTGTALSQSAQETVEYIQRKLMQCRGSDYWGDVDGYYYFDLGLGGRVSIEFTSQDHSLVLRGDFHLQDIAIEARLQDDPVGISFSCVEVSTREKCKAEANFEDDPPSISYACVEIPGPRDQCIWLWEVDETTTSYDLNLKCSNAKDTAARVYRAFQHLKNLVEQEEELF